MGGATYTSCCHCQSHGTRKAEPSILTFADRHDREIGDYPQEKPVVDDEDSMANYDYVSDVQDSAITGVGEGPSTKPTGVEVADLQVPQDVPQSTNADTDFRLEQEPPNDPHEHETTRRPTSDPTKAALPQDPAPPCQGMAARNARVRKPLRSMSRPCKARRMPLQCLRLLSASRRARTGWHWPRCLSS